MPIDHDLVRNAFLSLGLFGDKKSGLLRRYGMFFSVSPVDFFVFREFDLIGQMSSDASKQIAEKVLIDAAQWCANGTFGGIMASPEWKSLIEPNINGIQDRLSGLVAITNCLGWGKIVGWDLDQASKTLSLTVENSYYVGAFKKRYGKNASNPICYMWTGVAAGYMDLFFGQHPNTFTATEKTCAASGGGTCTFEAKLAKAVFGFD